MGALIARVMSFIRILFTKTANTSTPEGRGQERYRHAAWTTLVMLAARVSNIITGVLSVPITLHYLGQDLYGIWMALTGFIAFLSFYDFGIGTGLRNLLIECVAKDDSEQPKQLIGTALLVLSGLAVIMIAVAFFVLPYLPWAELIKCKDPASAPHILPAAQAVLIMFAVGLPITQLQNIANAYQRGYWGYLCFLVGRIMGFIFVIWCVQARQPLWMLAGGYVGIPFLITLVGWVFFFVKVPLLRPWPFWFELGTVRRLFGIGVYVLVHHLSYALINTSGLLLITGTIGASSAVPYSVTQQMLGVSNVFVGSLLVSISAAIGEAWHRQEYDWIQMTLHKMEKTVVVLGAIPLFFLLLTGQYIVLWWTKTPAAVPAFSLLLACILVTCFSLAGDIYSNSLIAMNYVRFIALTKLFAGFAVVAGGLVAGGYFKSPSFIVFVQFFAGSFIPAVLFRIKMKRLLQGIDQRDALIPVSGVSVNC